MGERSDRGRAVITFPGAGRNVAQLQYIGGGKVLEDVVGSAIPDHGVENDQRLEDDLQRG